MAVIKKKFDDKITEFPYNTYGLNSNGTYKLLPSYKGESVTLYPDGYSNQKELQYSCVSTVAKLLEEGKTAIYTDDTETHNTLWKSIRDGLLGSNKNDIIYLGYEDDHVLAGLGDDFIELENQYVSAHGDEDDFLQGDNDVFIIKCGHTHVFGDGGNDHYFINMGQTCQALGITKEVTIYDSSYNLAINKIHLCDFKFQNTTGSTLDVLNKNGIYIGLSDINNGLELYFKDNSPLNQPDIIISQYCDNAYGMSSINPPITAIVDKDGIEISLKGMDCTSVAEYIASHNDTTAENSNRNALKQSAINETSPYSLNFLVDYFSDVHLLCSFKYLISNIGEFFGSSLEN